MTASPIGTTPRQALPVFVVNPSTGLPSGITGSAMPSPPTSFPAGGTPQHALPVVIVDPYTGLPLTTSHGSGAKSFSGSATPQQAIPAVLVDPTTGVPFSAAAALTILASLATVQASRIFSVDFSGDFV